MIKVSVVIPTFRRQESLEKCLRRLCGQDLDARFYEIIVADDENSCLTEALVEGFKREFPFLRFQYVFVSGHHGPAAARNSGWQRAQAPIIAFTDDDCLPEEDWLSRGLEALDEKTDAIWGKVIVPLSEDPTDYELNMAGLSKSEFVSANCFCRTPVLWKVGGFDERFSRAWREDSDLYFSLLEQNARIKFTEDVRVVHPARTLKFGTSILMQKNNLFEPLLYKKHIRLYREHVHFPILKIFYMIGVCFVLLAVSLVVGLAKLAAAALFVWFALTVYFITQRLRQTSHDPRHVWEIIVTSVLIPPAALYWRIVGALRFRVPFI